MRKLIVGIILCIPFFVFCQNQNEVKLDVYGLGFSHYELSYERIINENWGVEVGFRFRDDSRFLDTIFSVSPPRIDGLFFDETSFQILFHGKYYVFPKPFGNRLMLGAFLIYTSKSKFEEGYDEAFLMYKNIEAPRPFPRWTTGVSVGYKFLVFKKKLVIEPVIGIGLDLSESEFNVGGFGIDIDGFANLKLGYRF